MSPGSRPNSKTPELAFRCQSCVTSSSINQLVPRGTGFGEGSTGPQDAVDAQATDTPGAPSLRSIVGRLAHAPVPRAAVEPERAPVFEASSSESSIDALPRQYASHSSPRRHRRDCVSMTASARWRERLELLNVVDWGLSRLPPALRIIGDVSRSRFAFASDRWLPMDLVPHLGDGGECGAREVPCPSEGCARRSPLVLRRRVAAPWTGTSLC